MPLYEYKCPECGEKFEELASASSQEPVECPKCGSVAKRQISGFAIGSGGGGSVAGGGFSHGSSCKIGGG